MKKLSLLIKPQKVHPMKARLPKDGVSIPNLLASARAHKKAENTHRPNNDRVRSQRSSSSPPPTSDFDPGITFRY